MPVTSTMFNKILLIMSHYGVSAAKALSQEIRSKIVKMMLLAALNKVTLTVATCKYSMPYFSNNCKVNW